MSAHLALLQCPLGPKNFHGYQEFMNHVISHLVDLQEETYAAEGSNTLSVPLLKPLEFVQLLPPTSPPPPSSHPARSVRCKEDGRGEHTNQQLLAPPPPSVHMLIQSKVSMMADVCIQIIRYHHYHKHIILPHLEKMLMAKVYKQTNSYYHHHPHIMPTQLEVTLMAEVCIHTNIYHHHHYHIVFLHSEEMIMEKAYMQTRGNKCFNRQERPMSEVQIQ
ncbi:hypothetical protein KY284_036237 [Solanum tuberosum]|nr:hypothetical protein KY284_036237 [Solanum tuberosum]